MIDFFGDIESARIILVVSMLGLASFFDFRKREVSDLVWIIFGALGVVLFIIEPVLIDALITTGFALIVAPFAIFMWRIGFFGGADAFALITIAILAPQMTFGENIVTPFTVMTNAALFSIIPLFVNAARNLIEILKKNNIFEGFQESYSKRIIAMFVGYRAKNPKFSFSMEQQSGNVKKLSLSFKHAETSEYCTKPNTWVTPAIPYMLFITIGFLAQLIYGDLIFQVFNINWF